ncbi:MAG: hypothetical protein RBU37_26560, partial [Myxococcota bacterium]|nr:hypothetical protein [Myxococcota bacterium]
LAFPTPQGRMEYDGIRPSWQYGGRMAIRPDMLFSLFVPNRQEGGADLRVPACPPSLDTCNKS